MSTSIIANSSYSQWFQRAPITGLAKVSTLTPTIESKQRYNETNQTRGSEKSVVGTGLHLGKEHANALMRAEGRVSNPELADALELMHEQAFNKYDPVEATTASGTRINVERTWEGVGAGEAPVFQVIISREGNLLKEFTTNKDVRITELENGEFEIVELAEGDAIIHGTEGNDIILSRTASEIFAGGGDDTILVMGPGGTYDGGDGNDQFLFAQTIKNTTPFSLGGKETTILGGSGNDSVHGGNLDGVSIDLADGSNTVEAGAMNMVSISMGNGDNNIKTGHVWSGNFSFGDGDNTLEARGGLLNANVTTGHGANTVSAFHSQRLAYMAGDGDNKLGFHFISQAQIDLGDGQNALFSGVLSRSEINMGNGDNLIYADNIDLDSKISLGSGDNSVYIRIQPQGGGNSPNINLGGGNSQLVVGKDAHDAKQGLLEAQDSLPKNFSELLRGIFDLQNGL